jgi:hypothetical protein
VTAGNILIFGNSVVIFINSVRVAASIQNLLYNKSRNSLNPEHVNKLIYIYINLCSLKRDCAFTKDLNYINDPWHINKNKLLRLEDNLALPSVLGKRKRSLED